MYDVEPTIDTINSVIRIICLIFVQPLLCMLREASIFACNANLLLCLVRDLLVFDAQTIPMSAIAVDLLVWNQPPHGPKSPREGFKKSRNARNQDVFLLIIRVILLLYRMLTALLSHHQITPICIVPFCGREFRDCVYRSA